MLTSTVSKTSKKKKKTESKTMYRLEMKTGDFMEGNSVLHQELP